MGRKTTSMIIDKMNHNKMKKYSISQLGRVLMQLQ